MAPRNRKPIPPVPSHLRAFIDAIAFEDCVYFAEDRVSGLTKIGVTWAPRVMERMREHERKLGLARLVTLLALVVGGHRVERAYHAVLADTHVGGEWFAPSPQLSAFIDGAAYWQDWAALL